MALKKEIVCDCEVVCVINSFVSIYVPEKKNVK